MSTETAIIPAEKKPPEAKAIVPVSEKGVQFTDLDGMWRFAVAVGKSRLAPKGFESPEAILVAMQYGLELGVGPMQALQGIAVINGRPSVWGDLALAVCQSKPDFEDIIEAISPDGFEAKCTVKRKGRTPTARTFSMDDAKKANLLGKPGPWQQYPRRMLQMRARAFALRDCFADALKGISIREEAADYQTPSKEPKQVTGIVMPDEPEAPAQPETTEPKEEKNGAGEFIF